MEPADLLALVESDPVAAADHIDQAAQTLQKFAGELRASQKGDDGFRQPSGMVDRIRARVIGPSGEIKQTIDTQEQS